LPDAAAPFAAGPLLIGDGFVRRRYQRGTRAVDVTVAVLAQGQGQGIDGYEGWLAQSRDYPQAALGLPPDAANGFYTGGGTAGPCALHIQTRSGFHIEMMGEGGTTCADLDELVARIPLAPLL
jgi:hypothetical protein